MLKRRGKMVVLGVLFLAILGSHFTKARLDVLQPEEAFEELLYVPKGQGLKLLACGFEAPLSDFLWLKGWLYYSENFRAAQMRRDRAAKYRYVYQLHDIITDLTPRFGKAYIYGALFLTSTGKEHHIRDGIRLLEKGLSVYDEAERSGEPVIPDERWQMCVSIGNTYDQQLHDLNQAMAWFDRAVDQPDCPSVIFEIRRYYQLQAHQGAGLLERYGVIRKLLEDQLKRMGERGSLGDSLQEKLKTDIEEVDRMRARLQATREIEAAMSKASALYKERTGQTATSVRSLLQARLLSHMPRLPFHGENDYGNIPDYFMFLPTGEVKSYIVARMEADLHLQQIFYGVQRFYSKHHRRFPGNFGQLVAEGILKKGPVHPLRGLGFRLSYNPVDGTLGVYDPEFKEILRIGDTRPPPGVKPVPRPDATLRPAPENSPGARRPSPVPPAHVRVAAIQFCSEFGKPGTNRKALLPIIQQAAEHNAQIVVLPEACIPGYADLTNEIYWTEGEAGPGFRQVREVAEAADGESFQIFSRVARKLRIYLTLPLIEKVDDRFYVTVILIGPEGRPVLHHRKHMLWVVADPSFASEGPADPPVVDTPFGRIGVMICYDMHVLPRIFAEKEVDLVLHSAAFYGPNFEGYLRANKFTKKFTEHSMHLVLANWSVKKAPEWSGYGMSRVLRADGRLLSRARHDLGNNIVIADLPIRRAR